MASSIRIRCPGCAARIKAPSQLLGQVRGCPRCKQRLLIQTRAPEDAQPMLLHDEAPASAGPSRPGRF